jgi:potassium efflux system protein
MITTTEAEDGRPLAEPLQVPLAITLKDLAVALIIGFITFGAVRNLPGLLEITLLQRLHLPAGERNAITTIVRYTITLLGIVLAFDALGIGWSKVQWLVAALSLGLGFGLQEIFANFVSGIIILFERPIRVGDTVTVGNVSGEVSKIRIRATTITDFDRKELIVPNKEFVTGQLVNWTLTDSILRVTLQVGIAYGSDTGKAVKLMYQIVSENPLALTDPEPQVLFLRFGDSALIFELRAYCDTLDNWLPLKHELHMNVDRAFRQAGIEIAFPQRDVHVRSIDDALSIVERAKQQRGKLLPVESRVEPPKVAKKGGQSDRKTPDAP